MDKNIFEVWGQLFLNAAKTQKQMEDFGLWMSQGLKSFEQMASLFPYARQPGVPDEKYRDESSDYMKVYRQSMEAFLSSFREYIAMFEMVPKADYLALEKKIVALEEKCRQQDETIAQLKLMGTGSGEHSKLAEGFRELLEQQANDFQELMKNLSTFTKKKKDYR
jgi:formyltetrahydrofolate synthetase